MLRQETKKKRARNSYATPAPVTDGQRIYAVFGDGSIVAVDFDGNTIWTHRKVKHFSEHGLGASPILFNDLLILSYDGSAVTGGKVGWKIPWDGALVLALDVNTGQVRWQGTRGKSRIAHVTPNVMEVGGRPQLLSAAGDVIQGFEPTTGNIVWQNRIGGNHSASPVWADGLIYSLSNEGETTVIRDTPEFEVVADNPLEEHCQASMPISGGRIYIRTEYNLYAIRQRP